jgi:integrase
MPSLALTDAYVRAVDPPASGRLEVTDLRCPGLTLRVTQAGVRTFAFRYRDKLTGRVERLTLGKYPDIALADARRMAGEQRVTVSKGTNPRKEVRKARAREQAAMTIDALLDKYLAEHVARNTPKSAATVRSYLSAVRRAWGPRKAKDVERADVITFLRERAESAPVAANRTRTILSTMFGWAVSEEILDATPMQRIPKPTKEEKARDRVLTEREIAVLWPALDELDGAMGFALKALLLTGQRPGEILGMTKSELTELDRPALARWELPPERVKNGRRHVVPLTEPVLAVIGAALALHDPDKPSPAIFASRRNDAATFDRHSIARAMKRLLRGLEPRDGNEAIVAGLKAHEPTPHDLRRTAITGMMSLGIGRETVKSVVNHAEGDITEAHYDRYDRLPEKRAALSAWAARVLEIVRPSPAAADGTVVQMRARKRA